MVRRFCEGTFCSPGMPCCSAIVCHGAKRAGVACCGFLGRRLLVERDVSLFIMAYGRQDPNLRKFWSAAAAKSERSRNSCSDYGLIQHLCHRHFSQHERALSKEPLWHAIATQPKPKSTISCERTGPSVKQHPPIGLHAFWDHAAGLWHA